MRNLTDEEKISYVLIGIAIGIAVGFLLKVWIDTTTLINTIGVHI
jgi:hypothetical protein|tara:strand:- start:354 stop:488 length:135 start_codon:yes stop_codon:yes gene_type:complete